jgi:AbiU2
MEGIMSSRFRTEEEVKQDHIAKMGPDLGPQFSALWLRVVKAHVYWGEFLEMFSTKPERLEVMNRAAPAFFHMLQGELGQSILLHLSRITDKQETGRQKNLTIRNLPGLITDAAVKAQVQGLVDDALAKTEVCRAHRNSLIAHDDLLLALNDSDARSLDPATKADVDAALKAIGEVLRVVNLHFTDSDMMFDLGNPRVEGFVDLLYVMNDGLKAREERGERIRTGKYRPDDFKREQL